MLIHVKKEISPWNYFVKGCAKKGCKKSLWVENKSRYAGIKDPENAKAKSCYDYSIVNEFFVFEIAISDSLLN